MHLQCVSISGVCSMLVLLGHEQWWYTIEISSMKQQNRTKQEEDCSKLLNEAMC